jgi:prevent-host-death family protein
MVPFPRPTGFPSVDPGNPVGRRRHPPAHAATEGIALSTPEGTVLSDDQVIREVSLTQLDRKTFETVRATIEGERVIVTKHGSPVAVLVGIEDGIDLLLAGSERFALLRREAREELSSGLATDFESLWETERQS